MASILFEKTKKKKKLKQKKVYFFSVSRFRKLSVGLQLFQTSFNFKLDRFGKKNWKCVQHEQPRLELKAGPDFSHLS